MARNTFIAVMMLVVAMCVNFSSAGAPLVRSAPQDQDRVLDFTISEARDSVSWTAFGREWTVRLELSDVMEDNTDYFHGTLQGDANAVVSFALLPGSSLSGMIGTSETTWWIRAMPVAERNYSEDEDDLGVFMVREHSSLQTGLPSFSTPLEPEVEEVSNENSDEEAAAVEVDVEANRKRTINTYKVGVFHDQNWAGLKNPWRSRANTLALFNDVNAIYRASGLGQFTPVYLKQITNNQKSLNDMLNYFANTASKNIAVMADKSYTNYVWLVGTNVGGLAYVGTSCGNASQKMKTAVVGLVSYSRLWSVKTIAHELAHNRGAVHEFDNACTSSLTKNCQCSIMSYCFPSASNNPRGAVNFFSDTSINKMKSTGCH